MITMGRNGEEVETKSHIEIRDTESHVVIETADVYFDPTLFIRDTTYHKVIHQSVCLGCGWAVESPEGHDDDECRENIRNYAD